jgi:type IV secretion system protein VirB10
MKLIILLGLFLIGCQEEKILVKEPIVEVLENNLYDLPDDPPPAPVPPATLYIDNELVNFSDPNPLMRENRAKFLRGERRAMARQTAQEKNVAKNKTYIYKDDEYAGVNKTISSFPVDRARMITTDMLIPAQLGNDLNSQLPGKVILIVDRDVMGHKGLDGRQFILLPAYSKIVCTYESLASRGQTRLKMICSRILTPDHVNINLVASISDQMGRTGVIGDVDNRVAERYGAAFIVSGLSALSQTSVKSNNEGVQNAANILSNNLGQVTNEIIRDGLDLKPILTAKAGDLVLVHPENDLIFKPPIEASRD